MLEVDGVQLMSQYHGLEEKVRKTGREIYSLIGEEIPTLMNRMRWKGKIFGYG